MISRNLQYEQFVRMKDLANRPDSVGLIGVSPQTIWRWIKENRFPKPVKVGAVSLFRMSEIQAWMNAQG